MLCALLCLQGARDELSDLKLVRSESGSLVVLNHMSLAKRLGSSVANVDGYCVAARTLDVQFHQHVTAPLSHQRIVGWGEPVTLCDATGEAPHALLLPCICASSDGMALMSSYLRLLQQLRP